MGKQAHIYRKNNREYNIKEYGVKGNGYSETATLQRIINEAVHNGGGTIVIPAGEYLSGALFFPRGVDLRIEKNAKLISTVDPNEFPVIPTRFEGIEKRWRCAFLNFDHSDGVKVYGEGVIDGKGVEWKKFHSETPDVPDCYVSQIAREVRFPV